MYYINLNWDLYKLETLRSLKLGTVRVIFLIKVKSQKWVHEIMKFEFIRNYSYLIKVNKTVNLKLEIIIVLSEIYYK